MILAAFLAGKEARKTSGPSIEKPLFLIWRSVGAGLGGTIRSKLQHCVSCQAGAASTMHLSWVVEKLASAQERIGRELNPTVFSPIDFQGKVAARQRFLTQVLSGPKIFVIGDARALEGLAEKRMAGRAQTKR